MNELIDDVAMPDEEGESYKWGIEKAIATAEANGIEVIRSTATTLLLDLDDGASLDTYRKMFCYFHVLFELKELDRWTSRGGIGTHVVLSCKPLAFPERVALQACLGSDRVREGLAIGMALDGKENPSVLFRPKRS